MVGIRHLLFAIVASLACAGLAVAQNDPPHATAGVCNVRDFGASGAGNTKDTDAITAAIRACAEAGGGTVLFPAGQYVTGTFELVSNITLNLEAGATIVASGDLEDYGSITGYGLGRTYGVDSSGEGERVGLIIARDAHDVAIVGRGTIDGRGSLFMSDEPHIGADFDPQYVRNPQGFQEAMKNTAYGPLRPKLEGTGRPGTMLIFRNCRNVLIRDVTLKDSPNWTLHLQSTEQVVVSGIHIVNNPVIPNNDGIDCIGCRHVHISDCDIQAGDDDFAFYDSEHVTVTNCSMTSRSAAIRLEGTRFSTFQNLSMDSNRGIGIFHSLDTGGDTDAVLFSGITMRTRLIPGHWWGKAEPIYVAVRPCAGGCKGSVKNVTFTNITAESESGALIYGTEANPISGLTLDGVRLLIKAPDNTFAEQVGGNFDLRWTSTSLHDAVFKHDIPAMYCRWVRGMRVRDLQIQWEDRVPEYFSDGIRCENFRDLRMEGFEGRQAQSGKGTAISLVNGADVAISGATAAAGTATLLKLTNVTGKRVFANHDASRALRAIDTATTGVATKKGGRQAAK